MKVYIDIIATQFFYSEGEVPFKIRLPGNYPVDLYFVIDFSHSMTRYTKYLREAVYAIVNATLETTPDYMIGLGVFGEKTTRPFKS